MYWAMRSSMTSQAATTTKTVISAVSGMNHSEMPSMPRKY